MSEHCYNSNSKSLKFLTEAKTMKHGKLLVAKYLNPTTFRIVYILLALLAMALAGGAPDAYGGH